MSIDAKRWAKLKAAWDAYGHEIPWEGLHAVKTDSRACYAVVCWRTPEGALALADLARAGISQPWEMQNDGHAVDLTDAEWAKLVIEPECDNFYVPGHAEYKSWGGQS